MKPIYLCLLSAAVLAVGCDISQLAEPSGGSKKSGGGVSMTEAITGIGIAQEMEGGTVGGAAPQQPAEQAAPSEEAKPEEPQTERVKADVGMGKKGHYGQQGGKDPTDIITVPVATLFRAKEMTAFRIQVPQALQLYEASNDGKGPETHEEFMEKIIKANNIPLPELPAGQKYVYDPEKKELMIEKPR